MQRRRSIPKALEEVCRRYGELTIPQDQLTTLNTGSVIELSPVLGK